LLEREREKKGWTQLEAEKDLNNLAHFKWYCHLGSRVKCFAYEICTKFYCWQFQFENYKLKAQLQTRVHVFNKLVLHGTCYMPHTHTHTHTWHNLTSQSSGRQQQNPIWAAFATDTGTSNTSNSNGNRGTGRDPTELPQNPKNGIRMPLKCGSSDVGIDRTTGAQDRTTGCLCFRLPSKPIIFSCYICISKKSNGTNPNSTKDEQIQKYDQPASLESMSVSLSLSLSLCLCAVCVRVVC